MSTFRRIFGVVCFAHAGLTFLWFFKLISLDVNILLAGFLVITAISVAINAFVARQEKRGDAGGVDS